jgi:hypothetical protein
MLLGRPDVRGNIVLRTEEFNETKEKAVITALGTGLEDITGWFGKFKPFFYLSR